MTNFKDNAKKTFTTSTGDYTAYDLNTLGALGKIDSLPYSIKVLLEACLRNLDNHVVFDEHIKALAGYDAKNVGEQEIPFTPGRVVLQDFTGVPAVVDLAALRSAMARLGGDVQKVNPLSRVDLVIDHSVQVDDFGTPQSIQINKEFEFERNLERYQFLKWGQKSFNNFTVVPPETGIVHQVNLENLATVVLQTPDRVVYPDSLVGTDSHTTMINGLGVLGWGVGGIEAEAAMLGQPSYMLIPEVVGFRLTGALREGATATDLVLTVTQMLRKHGVVSKFVEFYGPGLSHLTLADRATIANMAPEYGATMGYFPVDEKTLDYMRLTGRSEELIELVEAYTKLNGLWRNDDRHITYSSELVLDLGEVQPSLAGPKRPQDRILLSDMKGDFNLHLKKSFNRDVPTSRPTEYAGQTFDLTDGDVVIAAITSCTNTSNPAVMIGAGLLAKKANLLGLKAKPWVKTSLAPGSRVVTDYLDRSGLSEHLEAVGFYTVGYGCTTCIGNSGPLPVELSKPIEEGNLVAASVLSGNRNFEGRISPHTQVNYLASPPLVVAYALAGSVNIDIYKDPIGKDKSGKDVFLKDVWPSNAEIAQEMSTAVTREQFVSRYAHVFDGPKEWQEIQATESAVYDWPAESTYVQEPPYFINMPKKAQPIKAITGAKVLLSLGDSVTTDHISPAGAITKGTPAAQYLDEHGVEPRMYNSYGSRRGNDRIMTRGTFANIRIRNKIAPGTEGGYTTYMGPDETPAGPFTWLSYDSKVDPKNGEVCFVYDAAVKYQKHQIPLVVLAGVDYGMGSSRDWAAKGAFLLGIRAVIAQSYERIHRSNLIGMGVLPLQFKNGDSAESLGLSGHETFSFDIDNSLQPLQDVQVTATAADGSSKTFAVQCRIDTPVEVDYYRHGGILHYVLRRMAE